MTNNLFEKNENCSNIEEILETIQKHCTAYGTESHNHRIEKRDLEIYVVIANLSTSTAIYQPGFSMTSIEESI